MESRLPRKLFTLAEANRTLPLVRRVVEDIMTVYPEWKDLVAQYELIAAQARPDWGESQEQLDLKSRIDAVAGGEQSVPGVLVQNRRGVQGLRARTAGHHRRV